MRQLPTCETRKRTNSIQSKPKDRNYTDQDWNRWSRKQKSNRENQWHPHWVSEISKTDEPLADSSGKKKRSASGPWEAAPPRTSAAASEEVTGHEEWRHDNRATAQSEWVTRAPADARAGAGARAAQLRSLPPESPPYPGGPLQFSATRNF